MNREDVLPAAILAIVAIILFLQVDTHARVSRIEATTQQILAMPEDHD